MKKLALITAIIGTALMFGCSNEKIAPKDLDTKAEVIIPGEVYASPILKNRYSCEGKLLREKKFMGMNFQQGPDRLEYQNITISGEELHDKGYQYVGDPEVVSKGSSYYCDPLIWIAGLIGAVLLIILWYLVLSQKKRETPPPATPSGASSPTTALSTEITKVISGLTQTGGTVKVSSKGGDNWEVTIPTPPKTGASPKKETPTPDKGKGQ